MLLGPVRPRAARNRVDIIAVTLLATWTWTGPRGTIALWLGARALRVARRPGIGDGDADRAVDVLLADRLVDLIDLLLDGVPLRAARHVIVLEPLVVIQQVVVLDPATRHRRDLLLEVAHLRFGLGNLGL